ncbi:MAG: ankyrin repeat domain-containing protein [Parashewanella sp.]
MSQIKINSSFSETQLQTAAREAIRSKSLVRIEGADLEGSKLYRVTLVKAKKNAAANFHLEPDVRSTGGDIPLEAIPSSSVESIVQRFELVMNSEAQKMMAEKGLFSAVLNGDEKVVEQLLKSGYIDVNSLDSSGSSALHIAAQAGHEQIVVLLLSYGAKLEATNHNGCTPLMVAVQNHRLSIVQQLLNQGAKVGAADKAGKNSLHYAFEQRMPGVYSYKNAEDLLTLLLNSAEVADMKMSDKKGMKPAHYLYSATSERVKDTLTGLVDANKYLELKAYLAAQPVSQELLNQNLFSAVKSGSAAVVEVLVDNLPKGESWKGSCHLALRLAASIGNTEVVNLLLEKGANPNRVGSDSVKASLGLPLMYAVGRNNSAMTQLLLSKSVKVEAQYSNEFVISQGWRAKTKIAAGANALHVAARIKVHDAVREVLNAGAIKKAINQQDDNGDTPLHIAVREKDIVMIAMLREKGASVDIANKKGLKAVDVTDKMKQKDKNKLIPLLIDVTSPLTEEDLELGDWQVIKPKDDEA